MDTEDIIGKWCVLTDPICCNQLCKAIEIRPSGVRMAQIGIVPFDEFRLATDNEITSWLLTH